MACTGLVHLRKKTPLSININAPGGLFRLRAKLPEFAQFITKLSDIGEQNLTGNSRAYMKQENSFNLFCDHTTEKCNQAPK
jgi:hypothetical protein